MFIEYVILDGFKSYSTRTVIGPLDPHFNAVTGLNGSGKSNVLDSLCFVFGISDLSTVRANKLDELIYKQGQAGITRASVTIIINNNKLNSPLMYPYRTMKEITITRQIAIGGKNRYFINNHPATPKNIFDFYNTARMNVNNARFLIMQGRVTKVVNMKPKELLELIEEASGTRIYENKKNVALRLIKRKDEKMQEIEKIIKDDISPMMQKLKSDKDDFLKYSSVKEEFDRLKRIQTYLKYNHYEDILKELEENYERKQDEMNNNINSVKDMEKLIETLNDKLVDENKNLQSVTKQVEAYNIRVDGLNKMISKLKSNRKITEKDFKELIDLMEQTNKEIELHTASLGEFGSVNSFNEFEKKVEADRIKLKELQELANTGGKVGQMSQLKSKISACKSELENCERITEHLKQEINKNEQKLKEYDQSKNNYYNQITELNNKKMELDKKLQELKGKIGEYGQGDVLSELQGKIRKLKEKRDYLEHDLCMNEQDLKKFRVNLNTSSNSDNYFGQIFDVLSLNELGIVYSVPIHVLMGYKFSYLVATDSKYARNLFKLNNFSKSNKKVTIVPLNDIKVNYLLTQQDLDQIRAEINKDKYNIMDTNMNNNVSSNTNDNNKYNSSKGHRGREDSKNNNNDNHNNQTQHDDHDYNNMVLGYWEVFQYEPKFLKLVQYISGNCVFCGNDRDARKIAYSKDFRKRFATSTLQGDKYDTTGTMSGGGNKYLTQVLKIVSVLKNTKKDLDNLDKEIDKLNNDIVVCKGYTDELYDLKSKHELCTSDLLSLEIRLKGGEYFTIKEKINTQKFQLETKINKIEELKEHKKQYEEELKELSKSNEGDLEEKIKILKESLKKSNHQLELLREQNVDQQLKKSTLEHQINSNKQELENKKLQKQTLEEMKNEQDTEIKIKEEELKSIKKLLEDENMNLTKVQTVIKDILKEKDKLITNIDESNLILKQMGYDIETYEKDINEYQVKLDKLKNEYPYVTTPDNIFIEFQKINERSSRNSIIDSNRDNTRDKDTSRDSVRTTNQDNIRSIRDKNMTKNDLAYVNSKLERLQKLKEKLSRRINQKAQQMYDNILYEYNDLMNKLSKVQNDRNKIEKTINDLDRKKQESLNEVFIKVNNHFSQIFSLLLNNATCKLVASDNKDINSGIIMKICFNNVWKNSLSELSGGQRSLLALSLILAMLKVKPAPIYILDEIDAALDLSHTQNIGKMVKQQFKYSQFIIISLKEGMFSNANTLFKVKFLNGRSVISRHQNIQNINNNDNNNSMNNNVNSNTNNNKDKTINNISNDNNMDNVVGDGVYAQEGDFSKDLDNNKDKTTNNTNMLDEKRSKRKKI